ncbi:hypothetical protein, partial : Uncharacterized protein OS=Myxococcus stipitatus (strain DSM 14675 / JCM 12634 / Mx s8) GN=MYSTI_03256 PE=4 SV=1 [Gemmata massiliana]|uniref:Uncharacterized protein n=1 Tax=Gemmata massiliana TaxID=1210884 RepID=A0A6P2DJX3_9BACT
MSSITPLNPDDGRPGRPPKLTTALILKAAALLYEGNFRCDVARAVGIAPDTFGRWMQYGRLYPDGIYATFRRVVLSSEAQFKTRAVGAITAAAKHDPWLMLTFLERKYPQQFGKYRGELGELKRRISKREKELAELVALVREGTGSQ